MSGGQQRSLRKAPWPPFGKRGAERTRPNSFWGAPSIEPAAKEVARLVTVIREACAGSTDERALLIATAALHATAAYLAHRFKPREALAVIDRVRAEIAGE
jgi:hypothetical protein